MAYKTRGGGVWFDQSRKKEQKSRSPREAHQTLDWESNLLVHFIVEGTARSRPARRS
jgi:hypothetical protein